MLRNLVLSVWKADRLPTEDGVGRDGVLIGEALLRRPHPEVELLAEVLPVPDRRPQVPHPLVVQRHQDRRPPVRIHLMQCTQAWQLVAIVQFQCFSNVQSSSEFVRSRLRNLL